MAAMTGKQQRKASTGGLESVIRGFWWFLAGTVAWMIGGPAGVAITSDDSELGRTVLCFGFGAILVGLLQGWLLRRTGLARAWISASVIVFLLAAAWVFGAGTLVKEWGLWGIAFFGPAVGLVQWRLLRRTIRRAGWWIPASTLGWCLGGFLIGADSLDMHLETGGNPGNPVGWAVFGAAYGAVTGLAIA